MCSLEKNYINSFQIKLQINNFFFYSNLRKFLPKIISNREFYLEIKKKKIEKI